MILWARFPSSVTLGGGSERKTTELVVTNCSILLVPGDWYSGTESGSYFLGKGKVVPVLN
jgi:hypothetical protein